MVRSDIFYLTAGLIFGIIIFLLDLSLPYGTGVWLLYITPLFILPGKIKNNKYISYLTFFYIILFLLRVLFNPANLPSFVYLNRSLYALILYFVNFVQRSKLKAKTKLTETEDRYKRILDTMNEGCSIIDYNWNCMYVNYESARQANSNKEELLGKSIFEITPNLKKTEAFNILERSMLERIAQQEEISFTDLNNKTSWYELNVLPVNEGIFISANDITIRKETEEALRKSEEYLRTLADNISQFAWMADANGWIFWYNKRWYDYTGTTLEEMEGWGWQKVHHPDYVEKVTAKFKAAIETETFWEDTFPLKSKTGEYGWFLSRALPILNEDGKIIRWFGTNTDVTEIKNAEEKLITNQNLLKSEKELLQAIVDTVPAMISIYDPNLKKIVMNKALSDITGWTKEDYEKTNIMELAYPDPEYRKMVAEYMQSLTPGFKDITMVTKNGRKIETSWANVRIPDGRQVGIGIDITARKKTEKKLRATMQELEKSNYELEQFAYVASHDLQSPLRQISGFVKLIERQYKGKIDKTADEYMEFISSATIRMSKLIQGLLDLSRVKSKNKSFVKVNLNETINSAIDNIADEIKNKNAEIIIQEKLPEVTGDPVLLTQIFQNLIQNGIKFHSEETPEIRISSEVKNEEIIFSVKDNGIGIEKDQFEKIYTIFYKIHNSNTQSGYGIGLPMCKKIIEHHGGKIWVESEPGKGSTFYFILPQNHYD